MANERMGEVVAIAENRRQFIGPDSHQGTTNAAMFLVCRLLTDAIFSQDIRAIQLVINRIDGGLPRDTEVDDYQTLFSDCLSEVMGMSSAAQLSVTPDDTVMMAICKALYALATQDIYWDDRRKQMRRRPPTDLKQERDAALRIILDRLGGRKTLTISSRVHDEIEDADWISELPSARL